jgi:hypothetical protein
MYVMSVWSIEFATMAMACQTALRTEPVTVKVIGNDLLSKLESLVLERGRALVERLSAVIEDCRATVAPFVEPGLMLSHD